MKLLITGSRYVNPAMISYAKRVVARAKALDWSVIVGDANGIDATVIAECDKLGVSVEVHGAYGKLRHSTLTGKNLIHSGDYSNRDCSMAELCDTCMAIWDGKSRGTEATFGYAKLVGKQVFVQKF